MSVVELCFVSCPPKPFPHLPLIFGWNRHQRPPRAVAVVRSVDSSAHLLLIASRRLMTADSRHVVTSRGERLERGSIKRKGCACEAECQKPRTTSIVWHSAASFLLPALRTRCDGADVVLVTNRLLCVALRWRAVRLRSESATELRAGCLPLHLASWTLDVAPPQTTAKRRKPRKSNS